jgi:ribosomal protein S18 acetylase RimI-like enzyme
MPDEALAGLDPVARAEGHRQAIENGRSTFLVAVDATDEIVGFACAGPYRRNQDSNDLDPVAGEVYAIYVDPARWGGGAGRALMDATVEALTAQRRRPIRLWVLDANAQARRFYERYGFVDSGDRSSFPVGAPGRPAVTLDEVSYVLDPTA